MKKCVACGRTLPLDDFYRHRKMRDGRLLQCKQCVCAAARGDRKTSPAVRQRELRHNQTPARKLATLAQMQRQRLMYPERYKARAAVNNAVRAGKLLRQPCAECGETRVEAHHDDYAKPLEVQWLCRSHHMDAHTALEEKKCISSNQPSQSWSHIRSS